MQNSSDLNAGAPHGRVDHNRSWFALVAPFTTPTASPSPTGPPTGWHAVPIPAKDLVPAVAVLLGGTSSTDKAYRWWESDASGADAITSVDGRPAVQGTVQVFISRAGAGAVVVALSPVEEEGTHTDAWLHLVRRAGRVGRPDTAHDLDASEGVLIGRAHSGPAPLWAVLHEIASEAGVANAEFDDRAVAYSAVFIVDQSDASEHHVDMLARHFMRRVPLDQEVRTAVEVDSEHMIEQHIGATLYTGLRSAGFVGVNLPATDRFFGETLPRELRSQYLLALLLVVTHRTALLDLGALTAAAWHGDPRQRQVRLEELARTQATLAATGVLTQIMESTAQDRWHQKLVALYRLPAYQDEVVRNLAMLHNAVVAEATARLDRRVTALGVLVGIPSLAMAFFGLSISRITSPGGISLAGAVLVLAVSFSVAGLAWRWLTTRSARR